MRIGIVTFHCAYNYGSALQAFALKRRLTQLGHQVKVVHFLSRDYQNYRLFLIRRNPRRLFGNLFRIPWTQESIYVCREIVKDVLFLGKHMRRGRAFRRFWEEHFELTESFTERSDLSILNEHFDVFICGSDQIWNLDCTNGIVEPYFLSFADKPKIAYAPSLGHTAFEKDFDEARLRELLRDFEAVSVREEATLGLLKQYYDGEVMTAVDPTLLLDSGEYTPLMERFPVDKPYIFYYELQSPAPDQAEICRKTAQKLGLQVVYFSEFNKFGKRGVSAYGCTPGQWLYLLKNAAFVMSNSFHATVFSVLLERDFVVFPTQKSGERMRGLLNALQLSEHVYAEDERWLHASPDFTQAKKLLKELAAESEDFLISALNRIDKEHE